MFGHHESAQATVLSTGDVSGAREDGYSGKIEFVLEVYPPTGQAFRTTATHRFLRYTHAPQVGDVVTVKYDPKSLKVELDLNDDPRYGEKRTSLEQHARDQEAQARRAALLATPPGMPLASANLLSTLTGHTDTVWAVAWSPDGRLLASGSGDNTLRIWNLANGQPLTTLEEDPEDGVVSSIAWSPDGRLVAFCGANTHLWDATTGERYPPLIPDPWPGDPLFKSVAWSPNNRSLASSDDTGMIYLWDASTCTQQATLKGHTKAVSSVAWSPDGRRLASASEDQTVRLWNADTGQALTTLPAQPLCALSVAWSPDGRLLAFGGTHEPRIWDASTGRQLLYKWVGLDMIWAAAWSPDGRRLLATPSKEQVGLWDVHQGQQLTPLYGHTGQVMSVAWSPDGRLLASGGEDKTVRLWRME